jgi:hypothetical protein
MSSFQLKFTERTDIELSLFERSEDQKEEIKVMLKAFLLEGADEAILLANKFS